jgi:hypothetical protein
MAKDEVSLGLVETSLSKKRVSFLALLLKARTMLYAAFLRQQAAE